MKGKILIEDDQMTVDIEQMTLFELGMIIRQMLRGFCRTEEERDMVMRLVEKNSILDKLEAQMREEAVDEGSDNDNG